MKRIVDFFDTLEDKIRHRLSKRPILYAIVASVGTVLLWRGIWMTADVYNVSGPVSAIVGAVILLLTGVFVSGFIGNRVLLTGMRKEKKLAEMTKEEVEEEMSSEKKAFGKIQDQLERIENDVLAMKKKEKE
ncbi:MAG: hypothetical protein WC767_02700 [Candidatus Paceibacterota bacterium]|jgi:hypothetical protein